MSLTRKALTAMGIEGEKIDQIIELHMETVNGLKDQVSSLKNDADKLPSISKELNELKAAQQNPDEYKEKYEKEHEAFELFKKNIEEEKENSLKVTTFKQLLKENNIREDKMDLILKTVKLDDLKLNKDKTLENKEALTKSIIQDWSDFIEHTSTKGTNAANPPINMGEGNQYSDNVAKFRNALGIPELENNTK